MKIDRKIQITSILLICWLTLLNSSTGQEDKTREILHLGVIGADVKNIQELLIDLDYNDIRPTGLFGLDTLNAVRSIQKNNNLKVTGIIDQETKFVIITNNKEEFEANQVLNITENELNVLAKIIFGEARGEPFQGQIAVGAVVINRVKHSSFPNTIAGVIFEPLAFTAVADSQFYLTPNEEAFRAARDALTGLDPSDGALYYYNPAKVTSNWIWSRPVIKRIGKHTFAR